MASPGSELRANGPAIAPSAYQAANRAMVDRQSLRLGATLLFAGILLSFAAGSFHPEREPANNHAAAFAEYASSNSWTLVHLGQFVGMVVLVAGLLALGYALNLRVGISGWIRRFGTGSAMVALALYGVLQAVDGVALKQAVNAWVSAPEAEKLARFASAEALRWLEWAVRSYHSYMLGLSLFLLATVVVGTGRIPRPLGILMGLSGLAYLVQGWVLGTEGFSATNTVPTLLGIVLIVTWTIWLLLVAWRMKESAPPSPHGEIG